MKYKNKYLIPITLLVVLLTLPILGWAGTTQWSLWIGNHYTGFSDYKYKIAEFDRGTEGFMPEFKLNYAKYLENKSYSVNGYFYDPKRMNFVFEGRSSNLLHARVSYSSFYRQYQRDLMENLLVRELGFDDQGNPKPGGKMVTHADPYPNEEYGFKRQEIRTDVDVKIPGMENIKLMISHRSILEKGTDQHLQTMHCSSCHVESKKIDLNNQTHSISGGLEAQFGNLLLSYQANYRKFKSDVGPVEAEYDSAGHPVRGYIWTDPNTGATSNYWVEFGSREIFTGEKMPIVVPRESDKFSHRLKLKGKIGKGALLAQYINSTTTNKDEDLNLKGNQASLKIAYPLFPKTKMIARGSYTRLENDPIFIDIPAWRENRPGGGQNMDWTRYSNLTRTEMKGDLELIYQPKRRYRLTLLAGYSSIERDDYPYKGANDQTNKIRLQAAVKYRPSAQITAKFKYGLDKIDNPFAPYNHMFERSGRAAQLMPLPNNSFVYYFQRDDLRYGDITSLPSMVHMLNADLTFRPSQRVSLTAGINARLGSNDDAPELSLKQTSYQPRLSFNYIASDQFSFFSSYSYLYQTQNGLAAVAMMDG